MTESGRLSNSTSAKASLDDRLAFEKRINLSSTDQLILFQHKIKQKQRSLDQDQLLAQKMQRSKQMKAEADKVRALKSFLEE